MIQVITNPRKVALNQFLLMLDYLDKQRRSSAEQKEKQALIYYTPQDVFGKLKPGLQYDDCISTLEKLDKFWRGNEQESLYCITQEERANGILLSVTIEISNNKLRNFEKV